MPKADEMYFDSPNTGTYAVDYFFVQFIDKVKWIKPYTWVESSEIKSYKRLIDWIQNLVCSPSEIVLFNCIHYGYKMFVNLFEIYILLNEKYLLIAVRWNGGKEKKYMI